MFVPAVTVTQDVDSAQPITLARGQHLEISLTPGVQWRLTSSDPDHALAAASAEGWYDASVSACIWRFTAVSNGTAQLSFSGLVLCQPPNLHCLAATETATFAVVVH
jgi:hypothetical protein